MRVGMNILADEKKMITLGKFHAYSSELASDFRHEFGHFIHYRGLSKSQWDDWVDIWKSKPRSQW